MSSSSFKNVFVLSQVVGIATCAVTVYWIQGFTAGLSEEFYWHVVTTTVGLVYLFALELLSYRFLRWLPIKSLHLIHAGIGVAVMVFTVFGYLTVYDAANRNNKDRQNWTTVHDWVGMVTTFIFVAQWVFSVAAYLYPKMSVSVRLGYLPLHVFIGHVTFGLSIITCITGYIEVSHYKKPEDYVIGAIVFLMIAFATLVVYLTTTQHYRRKPLESD